MPAQLLVLDFEKLFFGSSRDFFDNAVVNSDTIVNISALVAEAVLSGRSDAIIAADQRVSSAFGTPVPNAYSALSAQRRFGNLSI
jgi:hypothetical protein